MHSTTFFRAVMTALVLLCCALVAMQQGRARARPHMVTELVSVVYVPARPASAPAAAQPVQPAPSAAPATAVASAEPVPDGAKVAAAPERAVEARRSHHRIIVAAPRAAAGRVVAAAGRPKPASHGSKKGDKAQDTMVASAPPVPAFLMPVRRLGFSLQRRLVQAGVLKVCAPPSSRSSDCVNPAPDS
jgi:hypothetical protein